MMKFVLLCMLLAVVSAQFGRGNFNRRRTQQPSFDTGNQQSFLPRQDRFEPQQYHIVPILRFDQQGPLNGFYNFNFETGDGIVREEEGSPTGPNGAVVQRGSWSFTFPDGTPAQFSFVADERGYQVESPLLPQAPPMPAHALEQIAKAERERAAGIFHDGFYDHARYGGPGVSQFQQHVPERRNQQRRRFN